MIHKLIELFALGLSNTAESKIVDNDQFMADEFAPVFAVLIVQKFLQLIEQLIEFQEPNRTQASTGVV